MLQPLERKVLRHSRALLEPGAKVVVALSGGPDSSALLAALKVLREDLAIELVAAHLDHGMREESHADLEGAQALADRLRIPFVSGAADVPAEARARAGGSLEAAARAARYRFLAGVAADHSAAAVALGHTRDDQVETVLHRLLRGTGLRGLGGMPSRRLLSSQRAGVRLVRPLLRVTRAEVLEYLDARGLTWVEDASNRDMRFLRNRLRHGVIPLLQEHANPRVDRSLLRLAVQARRATRTLDRLAKALLKEASAPQGGHRLAALREADPAIRAQAIALLVAEIAPDRSASRHVRRLEQVVRQGRGAVTLPGDVRLGAVDGCLRELSRPSLPPTTPTRVLLPLSVPGEALDEVAGLWFTARLIDAPPAEEVKTDPGQRVLLDAARAQGVLAVRRRRSGDRFWPLGGPGHRSLKRFLIDQKVPREQRSHVPVVTLDDRPVWIVGHRIDEQFKVTPATAQVLELRASEAVPAKERGDRD